ncbi:NnrS [Azonexus hydrophilus]|uniref:NnrS n=1 Tax=Azonexus hydrophilus TaxID=418702 RepID=A0A1R1I1G2_9RHOO|nr:NnrS family protein [Azonexus hydrophilus]OMG52582.1 NnrS [Azonexus hydrophilus]
MSHARHPLWLVGFRPFFLLACLAGALLPLIWALLFSGVGSLTASPVDALRWHAHEMFFGFGWAVLGGFLLTSTKNWVNIRGHHGDALAFLAAAWLFERFGMAYGGSWPTALFLLSNNLFLGSIVAMLLWTLIRHRAQDSYRDNLFFIVLLPIFIVAKQLMLHGDFAAGSDMVLALFRLAFLVMLERTLTPFMKGAFQVQILRQPRLDMPIKLLGLILVGGFLLPAALTGALSLALALLLLVRFVFWKPQLAFRRIDIGIMYVGYLAIVGQLLLVALAQVADPGWVGSVATHLFTFGAMGCIIPAMIVRIANGHTGRKVVFSPVDRGILYIMLAALVIRIVIPQFAPGLYLACIHAAATCWLLAFSLLGWRYIPMLLKPRIDGREH